MSSIDISNYNVTTYSRQQVIVLIELLQAHFLQYPHIEFDFKVSARACIPDSKFENVPSTYAVFVDT